MMMATVQGKKRVSDDGDDEDFINGKDKGIFDIGALLEPLPFETDLHIFEKQPLPPPPMEVPVPQIDFIKPDFDFIPEMKKSSRGRVEATDTIKHLIYRELKSHETETPSQFLAPIMHKGQCVGFTIPGDATEKCANMYLSRYRGITLNDIYAPKCIFADIALQFARRLTDLFSKYFRRISMDTFYFHVMPFYVPNESIDKAFLRLKSMKSIQRSYPYTNSKRRKLNLPA